MVYTKICHRFKGQYMLMSYWRLYIKPTLGACLMFAGDELGSSWGHKYETLAQCWFNVGPSSSTLAQKEPNIWANVSCLLGRSHHLWSRVIQLPTQLPEEEIQNIDRGLNPLLPDGMTSRATADWLEIWCWCMCPVFVSIEWHISVNHTEVSLPSQQTKNICITFVQCQRRWADVTQMLYKYFVFVALRAHFCLDLWKSCTSAVWACFFLREG